MDLKRVGKVCVVGAGVMGSGISQVFAQAGYEVVIVDIAEKFLNNSVNSIRANLERSASKGKISKGDVNAIMERIKTTIDMEEDGSKADFVVEAVSEEIEIKKDIFNRLDASCKNHTILVLSEFPHNVATATGCTACHGQPPNGITRNNTDGAHTLHKNAGYGNIPQTGCNYCHSNGGINDGGIHPNRIYNVSFNASVSSITHLQNPVSGNDDTCAGVSCHTNGLSSGAKAGIAVWNGSTAGRCNVCHSNAISGLPSTGSHSTKHYNLSRGFQCATCHGTNADTGGQSGHKTNQTIDVSFTGIAAPGTFNSVAKTCNPYCHSPNINDPKPPNPAWGTTLGACGTACHNKPPAITRSGSTVHSGLTGSSDCEGCHGAGANSGTQTGHVNGAIDGGGASCTGCHSSVATSLGLHSNLSGTSAVEDSDCQTCHFGTFSMVTGAANSLNTLYCQACHTSSGTGPVKPTNPGLIKDGLSHGSADCKWCHAAGNQPAYKYHAIGPKGTATGANCGTCHTSNLMDEPFKAPGINHYDPLEECFYCHNPMDNHAVGALSDSTSPSLNTISVTTPVTSGTSAQIQATVTDGIVLIAAAQYQVTNISGTVIPWTNMTAFDGRFDSANEIVNSTLSTSNLIGTYTVSIKGMASAYKILQSHIIHSMVCGAVSAAQRLLLLSQEDMLMGLLEVVLLQ